MATDSVALVESISDQDILFHYRPSILSLTPFKDELSLENGGQPAIPSTSVRIADPDRRLFNYLQSKRLTEFNAKYLSINDDLSYAETACTISDFKIDNGVIDFDIRIPEEILDKEYMQLFTPVTFQWIEIPTVRAVGVIPTFSKSADVPWKIVGTDYRRTYFQINPHTEWADEQQFIGLGFGDFGYTKAGVDPSDAYTGLGFFKDRAIAHSSLNSSYDDFDRLPIYSMFRPYYATRTIDIDGPGLAGGGLDVTLYKSWGSVDFDIPSLMYNNHTEALFKNTRSYYYDFINNIFLQAFHTYSPGDTPAKGIDIPIISGTGDNLLDQDGGNTAPEYQYAHFGSATNNNYEIIAYLISGAGMLWTDGTDFYWRSGGQVTGTVNGGIALDNRPYHLSGIPNTLVSDPRSEIFGLTPTDMTDFRFKRPHAIKDPVWAANIGILGKNQTTIDDIGTYKNNRHSFDRILINSNNFTPDSNDPEYGTGFIHLGQKMVEKNSARTVSTVQAQGFNIVLETPISYKVFNRYKIHSVTEDVFDYRELADSNRTEENLVNPMSLIELQIHNRHLDPENDYAISVNSQDASMELPDPDDWRIQRWNSEDGKWEKKVSDRICPFPNEDDIRDQKVELYQLDYYVGVIQVILTNLSEEEINAFVFGDLKFKLANRYRGLRVDQVLSLEQLKTDVSSAIAYQTTGGINTAGEISVEELGANIVNNATERFGVCKGSLISVNTDTTPPTILENLFFHIPEESGFKVPIIDEPVTENPNTVQTKAFEDSKKQFKMFTNKLSYRPIFNSSSEQERGFGDPQQDYGSTEASEYFKNTSYRIIHNPVPQNSPDIGKHFPIIYGNVKRVPLMQVISKIALYEDQETAGDDIYVYASHPCDVVTGHDIVLEYEVENKTKLQSEQETIERQRSGLASSVAKSPFPSYEDGHVDLDRQTGGRYSRRRLTLPYHALVDIEALDGRKYKAIRLRGAEWQAEAGKSDKRYPIRNGLGSTPLYGSMGGWVDNYGEYLGRGGLIEHPIDIARHFIRNYGKKPYCLDAIDLKAASNTKSKTASYRAAVFMREPMLTDEFLAEITKQFCLFYARKKDKIVFYTPEVKELDYRKPILDKINIVGMPKENTDGYKKSVTEIVYRYNYDFPSDKFMDTIYLNAENNENLAKASKSLQNRQVMEVEAKWVNDHNTAYNVALNMAKLFGSKRRYFDLTVRQIEGIEYEVGDCVPLTIERLSAVNLPCYILSVLVREDNLVELKLLSFEESEIVPRALPRLSKPIITVENPP